MRGKDAGDGRVRSEVAASQLQGLVGGIVGVPGKDYRLEVQRAELFVMQARRFVGGGEIVAAAFGCNQHRCNAGLIGSEHAQIDGAASEPGDVFVALEQDAVEAFAAQPFDDLVVFRVQL